MKQSPRSRGAPPLLPLIFITFFCFFFLVHTSRASRDLLKQTQIAAVKVVDSLSQPGQQGKAEREDSAATFDILMGTEECEEGNDEECLKRRMISEAHLDYIYTQRHNKP